MKTLLTLAVLILFACAGIQAQNFSLIAPPEISICNSNRFILSMDQMPAGVFGITPVINGTTLILQSPFPDCHSNPVLPGNTPSEIVITNTSGVCPAFTTQLNTTTGAYEFIFASAVAGCIINFEIYLDCSLIPSNPTQSLTMTFNWTLNGIPLPQPPAPIIAPIDVKFPYFSAPSSTPVIIPGNYGQQNVDVFYEYKNIGSAPAHMIITFNDLYASNSGCTSQAYQINDVFWGVGTSPTAVNAFIQGAPESGIIVPPNHSLYIRENINITGCITSCSGIPKLVELTWRCDNPISTFCSECQHVYKKYFTFQAEPIAYSVERVSPSYNVALYDNAFSNSGAGCSGQNSPPDQWTFKVTNKSLYTTLHEVNLDLFTLIPFDKELTLISLNSVSAPAISPSGGASSAVITHNLVSSTTNFVCSLQVADAVQDLRLKILGLKPGGEVTFSLTFYRCCTGYDDFNYLLNQAKYYNHWKIAAKCTTICNTTVLPLSSPADTNYADLGGGYISGNKFGLGGDIDLQRTFTPVANNVTALPYPAAPSSSNAYLDYSIELNGIFTSPFDQQTLGYYDYNNEVNNMSGYIRAKIHTKKGLFIMNEANVSFWYQPSGSNPQVDWTPVAGSFYYEEPGSSNPLIALPPNECLEYDYYFYFRLSDLPTPADLNNIFQTGFFDFRLHACCDAEQPFVDYDVEFSLLQDEACLSGFNVTNHPPTCSGNCCWLPLSGVAKRAAVHCPGCLSPGIVERNYEMYRTTFGLEDNGNDRLADNQNSIQYSAGNNSNGYLKYPLVKKERSTHGDHLEDRTVAYLPRGVNVMFNPPDLENTGYCYEVPNPNTAEMDDDNIVLDVLQLYRTISGSGPSKMDLKVTGIEFYLDDPTFTSYPCLDQIDFENPMDPIPTILHLTFDPTGVLNVYEQNGEEFLFTFNLDQINNWWNSGPIPAGVNFLMAIPNHTYSFREDQQYRLVVTYSICGNTYSASLSTPQPEDLLINCEITDRMYLIGDPLFLTASPLYSMAEDKPNSLQDLIDEGLIFSSLSALCPSCTTVTQSNFGDKFLFICEGNGGNHYFYSTDMINSTTYNNISACSTQIVIDAKSQIHRNSLGVQGYNFFPYEFRPPSLLPDNWTINIPSAFSNSYALTSGTVSGIGSTGALITPPIALNPLPSGYPTISFDNTQSQINNLLNSLECNDGTQTATPVLQHQNSLIRVTLDFERTQCPTTGNYLTFGSTDSKIQFSHNSDAGCAEIINYSEDCAPYQVEMNNMNGSPNDRWLEPFPNLSLQPDPPIPTSNIAEFCWNINMSNLGTIPNPPYYTSASNVFFQIPDLPFFDNSQWSLTLTCNGVPTPLTYQIYQNTILFQVSNSFILNGDCILTLCGTQISCVNNTDFDINLGWNCKPYPANNLLCSSTVVVANLLLEKLPVNLVVQNLTYPSEFTACSTHTVSACFESLEEGAVLPDAIIIDDFGQDITINSVTLTNCNDPLGTVTFVTPGLSIPIGQNVMINDLLIGINNNGYLQAGDCFCVSVEFDLDCAVGELTLPTINLDAITYCGDSYTSAAGFTTIPSSGTSNCTNCFSIEKTANTYTISSGSELVTFNIIVCGNNNSDPQNLPWQTVDLWDVYPSGFTVVGNDPFLNISQQNPLPIQLDPQNPCTTISVTGIISSNNLIECNEAFIDNGTTVLSDTACINILPNCIDGSTTYSFMNPGGSTSATIGFGCGISPCNVSNEVIVVAGTLMVDDDMNFIDCVFKMEPGSEIIVDPNMSVSFSRTDLSACTKMWKGISMEIGSLISTRESFIQGAQYGIKASDRNIISINKTGFINNYIGLYVPPLPPGTPASVFNSSSIWIAQSQFYGIGNLPQEYQLQTDYLGNSFTSASVPYAGILAYQTLLNLNNDPLIYLPNEFTNLSNGIIGKRSDLRIGNCKFTDINPLSDFDAASQASFGAIYNGSAIYGNGQKTAFAINQVGFGIGTSDQVTFTNCRYGLYADRISLFSHHNKMENMGTAYHARHVRTDVDIYQNIIDTRGDAIQLFECNGSNNTIVWNNDIVFGEIGGAAPARGIRVAEASIPNNNSTINWNRINFRNGATNARTGIHIEGSNRFLVINNELNMTDNHVNRDGILINGFSDVTANCNFINGSADLGVLDQSGIRIFMGNRHEVSCNEIKDTENGFYLQSPLTFGLIQGNDFFEHTFAYRFGALASTANLQHYMGNKWNDPAFGVGSNTKHDAPGNAVPYRVNSTTQPIMPFSQDPPNWFNWVPAPLGDDDFFCDQPVDYCALYFPPDCHNCRTESDEEIASGNIVNAPYTDETLWMLQRGLLEKIENNPSAYSDSLMIAFYSSIQNTAIAQLKWVDDSKTAIYLYDSLLISSIEANVVTLTQQAETLKGLMVDLTIAIDSGYATSIIIDDINDIADAMNALTAANDSLINLVTNNRTDQVDDIDYDNSTILASETIETNEQLINDIYFSTISRDIYEFTSQQISVLLSVASQCPMSGGNSVMTARALYALVDPDMHYNDRELCMLDGIQLKQTQQILANPKCRLFPNPANESVTLTYQFVSDATGVLTLFNHVGQEILRYDLNANESIFKFSTIQLVPGVYYLNIRQKSETIDNLKLVIIR